MKFTREYMQAFALLHRTLSAINWKRFDEYSDQDVSDLELWADGFADYCSASCAGTQNRDLVEAARIAIGNYRKDKTAAGVDTALNV